MVPQQARTFLAEALGTFMLVFGGCMTVVAASHWSGGTVPHIVISLGFGLSLLAGLFAFAEISGGHFNPAVSLAMWLSRRMSIVEMGTYWVAQAIGGIGAGVFIYWITDRNMVKATTTLPGAGISQGTAFLVEALLTGFFLVVILQASQKGSIGLVAIPLTLVVIHLGAIPISGASVNPARSLGSALIGGNWHAFWVYLAGPAVGAVGAWIVHTLVVKGELPSAPDTAA